VIFPSPEDKNNTPVGLSLCSDREIAIKLQRRLMEPERGIARDPPRTAREQSLGMLLLQANRNFEANRHFFCEVNLIGHFPVGLAVVVPKGVALFKDLVTRASWWDQRQASPTGSAQTTTLKYTW